MPSWVSVTTIMRREPQYMAGVALNLKMVIFFFKFLDICFGREIRKLISNYALLGRCYYYHEAGTTIYGWCGFKPQNGHFFFQIPRHMFW